MNALASSVPDVASNISTIGIPLGPYRNLTTLTAAILATHPQCLVLNHAASWMLEDRRLDFFWKGDLEQFLKAAVDHSFGGERGKVGGDIRLSHAFDDAAMRSLYERFNGDAVLTPNIRTLYWKDSMRVTNHMERLGIGPAEFTARYPQVRFLLPIRRPLDCARSNLRDKFRHLTSDPDPTKMDLTRIILEIIRNLTQHRAAVLTFTEKEMDGGFLARLCDFLGLDPIPEWIEAIETKLQVRKGYDHEPEEKEQYVEMVETMFFDDDAMRDRLLDLLD
ncbi:sulfotransferase [Methyloligella halotolerans]|uniref:sulfotransferase n=1 Tax=Methyloligella halotolerans TaxID=1177755 RepID=UPI00114CF2EB|nr:sulfotransferase [Methyloligella halotolerans]